MAGPLACRMPAVLLLAAAGLTGAGGFSGCSSSCNERLQWTQGELQMAKVFRQYPTDKATRHSFHSMYHQYLSSVAMRACCGEGEARRVRMLEIGLGCSEWGVNRSFLWSRRKAGPGGSSYAWRALFPPPIEFDLHVMEYDGECATAWAAQHPGVATVHIGDQGNRSDLLRVFAEAGSRPFDVIIDDGSHVNSHQINTIQTFLPLVQPGGLYFVEDMASSCSSWTANVGKRTRSANLQVGGTSSCLQTTTGEPTILSVLLDWQKLLLMKQHPLGIVRHVDIWSEAAAVQTIKASRR